MRVVFFFKSIFVFLNREYVIHRLIFLFLIFQKFIFFKQKVCEKNEINAYE